MEPIHVSRLFDIMQGLGSDMAALRKLVNGRSLATLKNAEENFRKIIDGSTPSVYVLDLEKDVIDPVIEKYSHISKTKLRKKIKDNLNTVGFKLSTKEFETKVELIYAKAETALQKVQSSSNPTHTMYRNVFKQLGADLSTLFSSVSRRTIIEISDPENMGLPGKIVFIASSFGLIKNKLNLEVINPVLQELTEDKKAYYGNLRNAGHTAVQDGESYYTNTPFTTAVLFRMESVSRQQNKSFDKYAAQDAFVKSVPLFLEHKITFNKSFTKTSKILIDMGFSFVVPMDATANASSGGSAEKAALKNMAEGYILPGLVDAIKNRLAWLKDGIPQARSSMSLYDYLDQLFYNTAAGKPVKSLKQRKAKSGRKNIGDVAVPDLRSLRKATRDHFKRANVTNLNTQVNIPVENSTDWLLALQNLLNANLIQRVKENMGSGDRRDILNLRSGRFAESVKVESISMSRQGMLTVFYNYMKYPYATFSDGGRQEFPKSRDPKLLIAKSIRQIAGEQVANRLRSVVV